MFDHVSAASAAINILAFLGEEVESIMVRQIGNPVINWDIQIRYFSGSSYRVTMSAEGHNLKMEEVKGLSLVKTVE